MSEFEQTKIMVEQLLHKTGAIDILKLRASVISCLQTTNHVPKQVRSETDSEKMFIVKEFLQKQGLQQTLQVLEAEWGNPVKKPLHIVTSPNQICLDALVAKYTQEPTTMPSPKPISAISKPIEQKVEKIPNEPAALAVAEPVHVETPLKKEPRQRYRSDINEIQLTNVTPDPEVGDSDSECITSDRSVHPDSKDPVDYIEPIL